MKASGSLGLLGGGLQSYDGPRGLRAEGWDHNGGGGLKVAEAGFAAHHQLWRCARVSLNSDVLQVTIRRFEKE